MKTKGLIAGLFLLMINFVSAQYYGSYRSFSMADLFRSIDSETMLIMITFIVSFALLNFALNRTLLKDNKAISNIVALSISFLITWEISRSSFNLDSIFYSIGFSEYFLFSLLPWIVFIVIGFIIWKFKKLSPYILGAGLILLIFTDLIYEKGIVLLVGLALLALGYYLNRKKE